MASGASRKVTGSFTGTGSQIRQNGVGFRPTRVELRSIGTSGTSLVEGFWQDTMGPGALAKRVAAGTGSFVPSNAVLGSASGVTVDPDGDGFYLGADADMNVSTAVVHYTCWE